MAENRDGRIGGRQMRGKMRDKQIWLSHIVVVEKDQDRPPSYKHAKILRCSYMLPYLCVDIDNTFHIYLMP